MGSQSANFALTVTYLQILFAWKFVVHRHKRARKDISEASVHRLCSSVSIHLYFCANYRVRAGYVFQVENMVLELITTKLSLRLLTTAF